VADRIFPVRADDPLGPVAVSVVPIQDGYGMDIMLVLAFSLATLRTLDRAVQIALIVFFATFLVALYTTTVVYAFVVMQKRRLASLMVADPSNKASPLKEDDQPESGEAELDIGVKGTSFFRLRQVRNKMMISR
jgi:hypothetical protein